jgi:hypothetical protein
VFIDSIGYIQIKILKPVVDVIGALEFDSSTLGDVWIQTLKLYRTLKSLTLSSG